MHDIRAIRDNPTAFTAGLRRRGVAEAQSLTDAFSPRTSNCAP